MGPVDIGVRCEPERQGGEEPRTRLGRVKPKTPHRSRQPQRTGARLALTNAQTQPSPEPERQLYEVDFEKMKSSLRT